MNLPNLTMDVMGRYIGHAYPEPADFRLHLRPMLGGHHSDHLLTVEDSSGVEINTIPLTETEAEGIVEVAGMDHTLPEDDWSIPVGIERAVTWDLGDGTHDLVLNEAEIDEIAAWLRFSLGHQTWDGGDDWVY